jgi:hypothetical protein
MKTQLAQRILMSALVLGFLGASKTAPGGYSSARDVPASAEERDKFEIETAIYRHLFGMRFWKQRDYSATFLGGSDEKVNRLVHEFPHQVPKIKPSYLAELRTPSTPIDKQTGKPALILTVTVSEPEGDLAGAVGKYYARALIQGKFCFSQRKKEGK